MKVLTITSRSVTFELVNDRVYYSGGEFDVYLNGKFVRKENRNVFSLFSLKPSTAYKVRAGDAEFSFTTEDEVCAFDVKNFNAYGDGVHDDTPAFTAAVACLPAGGTLFVPGGIYKLSPLFLKSDVLIYLDKGATLCGKTDREDYPVLPAEAGGVNLGTWQGEEADCFASLITAVNCKNVKIIGEGTVDCNALLGDWYKNHRIMRKAWRPRGMFFNRCNGVLVQGVTVRDTPSWNLHPYLCRDVKILGVRLYNTPSMPTTDGIDPDACDGVLIAGAEISVGDDCISIKSGTLPFAEKMRAPCRNVTVRNCLMKEGHGGVVLGSELSGGIENVTVSRCLFIGTDRGLRIKTRRGRGRIGITDNIVFDNIVMDGVKAPFVVNMYYNMGDETGHTEYVYTTRKLPVDDRTPYIGGFAFTNMKCTSVAWCAGAFYGLPEAPIKSVTFENVSFEYDKNAEAGYPDMKEINEKVKCGGLYFQFVESVALKNVRIEVPWGEPVILDNVEKFNSD